MFVFFCESHNRPANTYVRNLMSIQFSSWFLILNFDSLFLRFQTYCCKRRSLRMCPVSTAFFCRSYQTLKDLPPGKIQAGMVCRALHQYRRGHGLESHSSLNFFITAMISHVFLSLLAVQIHDMSCIQAYKYRSQSDCSTVEPIT